MRGSKTGLPINKTDLSFTSPPVGRSSRPPSSRPRPRAGTCIDRGPSPSKSRSCFRATSFCQQPYRPRSRSRSGSRLGRGFGETAGRRPAWRPSLNNGRTGSRGFPLCLHAPGWGAVIFPALPLRSALPEVLTQEVVLLPFQWEPIGASDFAFPGSRTKTVPEIIQIFFGESRLLFVRNVQPAAHRTTLL